MNASSTSASQSPRTSSTSNARPASTRSTCSLTPSSPGGPRPVPLFPAHLHRHGPLRLPSPQDGGGHREARQGRGRALAHLLADGWNLYDRRRGPDWRGKGGLQDPLLWLGADWRGRLAGAPKGAGLGEGLRAGHPPSVCPGQCHPGALPQGLQRGNTRSRSQGPAAAFASKNPLAKGPINTIPNTSSSSVGSKVKKVTEEYVAKVNAATVSANASGSASSQSVSVDNIKLD